MQKIYIKIFIMVKLSRYRDWQHNINVLAEIDTSTAANLGLKMTTPLLSDTRLWPAGANGDLTNGWDDWDWLETLQLMLRSGREEP